MTGWHSSILVISSSPFRRAVNNLPTMVVISVSLLTIRKLPDARCTRPASHSSMDLLLDFRDPWGNRIEIVDYENIQFTKAPDVLRGMGLDHLTKNEGAKQQLTDKGMGGIDPFRADQRKDQSANH